MENVNVNANVNVNENANTEMKYIDTFTKKEQKAMEIAKKYLGQSFNIEKTADYQNWLHLCTFKTPPLGGVL